MPALHDVDTESDDAASQSADRDRPGEGATSRRRYLAALGAGAAAATAGCSGLPGAGPRQLSTEAIADEPDRVAWQFPATEGDGEGFGYAAASAEKQFWVDDDPRALRVELNATVSLDSAYRHDRYRFRLWLPRSYQQDHGWLPFYVEPPGGWEEFSTYYEYRGGRRELVVEHRGVETKGTILTPVVLDARIRPVPAELGVAFSGRFEESGWAGETVRVREEGRFTSGEAE